MNRPDSSDPQQPQQTRLCELAELSDPGTRSFSIHLGAEPVDIFLVHKDRQVHGYINSCPHRGVPMNWQPHQFLDTDGETIVCATHGARFRATDGACMDGPCRGRPLHRVPLQVRDGAVYLDTHGS